MGWLSIFMFLIIAISAITANILKNAKEKDLQYVKDDKTILIFRILMPGSVIVAFLVSWIDPWKFSWDSSNLFWLDCISAILFILGMALRWGAILSLKRAFTVKVSILKDHKLKKDGLYKWVRHPSYTGMYIYGLGYALSFHSILCIILIISAVWFSTYSRILVEEEVLESHFGEDYQEYKRKSWKLFPGIY
jgi:protein-S-isoprenylcysteine O-methyltransferase Ste14